MQIKWVQQTKCNITLIAFAVVVFLREIYFRKMAVFILMGSIWVPQIYRNARYGYREVPDIKYAISTTIHVNWIPIYLYGYSGNVLFFEPHYLFVFTLIIWNAFQLSILKI